VEEMIDDEQVLANKYVIEMNHHTGEKIRTSGPVVRFGDGMPEEIPSPALGQHTDDILMDVGFSKDQITKLHSDESVA
jgi:formyl-CoA transferase